MITPNADNVTFAVPENYPHVIYYQEERGVITQYNIKTKEEKTFSRSKEEK